MSKYKKMKQLKAVAASVVSFAQQGLWDYAET